MFLRYIYPMEENEERIVASPGQIIDAADAKRDPLKEGSGRTLIREQVRRNFSIYTQGQIEKDPARWAALSEDEQFAEFKAHHHDMLGEAEKRGWGAFGRD